MKVTQLPSGSWKLIAETHTEEDLVVAMSHTHWPVVRGHVRGERSPDGSWPVVGAVIELVAHRPSGPLAWAMRDAKSCAMCCHASPGSSTMKRMCWHPGHGVDLVEGGPRGAMCAVERDRGADAICGSEGRAFKRRPDFIVLPEGSWSAV